MLKKMKKGQTALEYTLLLIIVIGSFVGIQNYLKRGLQGRWRDSVDSLGEQYDPLTTVSDVMHTLTSTTNTFISTFNTLGGYWTKRTDRTSSSESKTGNITIGAY